MFARTKRLTLRPGWPEDAAALHVAIAHRAVAEKLARVPWPYTIEHARDWLARPAAAMPVFTILAHDLAAEPQLIGGIGLHPEEDGLQLGYWLTPAAWGRGYATEAGRQVVAIARDTLGQARLAAYHHADNPASGRVLRKLGFRETGRGPRFSMARAGNVDSVLLTLDLGGAGASDDDGEADNEVRLAA